MGGPEGAPAVVWRGEVGALGGSEVVSRETEGALVLVGRGCRNGLYVHPAPFFPSTHVVQGCLASHLWWQSKRCCSIDPNPDCIATHCLPPPDHTGEKEIWFSSIKPPKGRRRPLTDRGYRLDLRVIYFQHPSSSPHRNDNPRYPYPHTWRNAECPEYTSLSDWEAIGNPIWVAVDEIRYSNAG